MRKQLMIKHFWINQLNYCKKEIPLTKDIYDLAALIDEAFYALKKSLDLEVNSSEIGINGSCYKAVRK